MARSSYAQFRLLALPAVLLLNSCAVDVNSPRLSTSSTSPGAAAETAKPRLFDSGYEEDSSSCFVCHVDFKREELSAVHREAGITCMACHGDSDVHSSDELNIIRPDVIWGRAEIEAFCKQCHEEHEKPEAVEAFREEWLSKRRPNGRWVLADSVCTDCHGMHALVTEAIDFK